MAKKKKNSSKDKRVLIAALVVAGVTVAGSTFAWFTSKDEVTNRLTASADYNVAIAENFQPPETWVPGQEINKDASAVNTGNVDAFVRMWLDGNMRLMQQNTTGSTTQIAGYDTTNRYFGTSGVPTTIATTDASLKNAGLTLMDTDGNYYKTLGITQAQNDHLTLSTSQEGFPDTKSTAMSDVQSMQSGILAYAPDNAEYCYILNEETVLPIMMGAGFVETAVPAGTLVYVGTAATLAPKAGAAYDASGKLNITATETVTNASGTGTTNYKTVYVQAQTHDDSATFFVPQNVEYETFTPLTDGLYLFLRNENDANQGDPEFSGYYRKTQDIVNNETGETQTSKVVYYALNNDTQRANRSDYTVKGLDIDGTTNNAATYAAPIEVYYDDTTDPKNIRHVVPSQYLELYTAQYSDVAAANLKWYTNADQTEIYVVYDSGNTDATEFEGDNDIAVTISLANIGTTPEGWTAIGAGTTAVNSYDGHKVLNAADIFDASKLTYYYNNDVEAGDTTAKLVDKVTLHKEVTNKAYLAFDFDLNVNLESIQVTFDQNGNEDDAAVKSGWAATSGTNATGAAGTAVGKNPEITSITWAAS